MLLLTVVSHSPQEHMPTGLSRDLGGIPKTLGSWTFDSTELEMQKIKEAFPSKIWMESVSLIPTIQDDELKSSFCTSN